MEKQADYEAHCNELRANYEGFANAMDYLCGLAEHIGEKTNCATLVQCFQIVKGSLSVFEAYERAELRKYYGIEKS